MVGTGQNVLLSWSVATDCLCQVLSCALSSADKPVAALCRVASGRDASPAPRVARLGAGPGNPSPVLQGLGVFSTSRVMCVLGPGVCFGPRRAFSRQKLLKAIMAQGELLWLEQKIVEADAFGSGSSLLASDNVLVSRDFARQPPRRVRTRLSCSRCPPGCPSPPAGFPGAGVGRWVAARCSAR